MSFRSRNRQVASG